MGQLNFKKPFEFQFQRNILVQYDQIQEKEFGVLDDDELLLWYG